MYTNCCHELLRERLVLAGGRGAFQVMEKLGVEAEHEPQDYVA